MWNGPADETVAFSTHVLFWLIGRFGGSPNIAVAASTPGTARSVPRRRSIARIRGISGYVASGRVIENVIRRYLLNPGSTFDRLYTLRMSRPAPATRMTARAISTTK